MIASSTLKLLLFCNLFNSDWKIVFCLDVNQPPLKLKEIKHM